MAAQIDVNKVLGTVLIGTWVCLPLWTIENIQFYKYFTGSGKNDGWFLWLMIALLVFVEFGTTVDQTYWIYHYGIIGFDNIALLATNGPELPIHNILVGWTAMVTQWYLGYRLYKISKNWIVVACLALVSLAAYAFAWYISILIIDGAVTLGQRAALVTGTQVWLSLEAGTDVGISCALVFYLARFSKQTSFANTKGVLAGLILLAIESGTFSTLFAIATLMGATIDLDANFSMMFVFILGRVYGNTLLYNLNIRRTASMHGTPNVQVSQRSNQDAYSLGKVTGPARSQQGAAYPQNHSTVSVGQQTMHVVMSDEARDRQESDEKAGYAGGYRGQEYV